MTVQMKTPKASAKKTLLKLKLHVSCHTFCLWVLNHYCDRRKSNAV